MTTTCIRRPASIRSTFPAALRRAESARVHGCAGDAAGSGHHFDLVGIAARCRCRTEAAARWLQ
jgi:hypothetical protein